MQMLTTSKALGLLPCHKVQTAFISANTLQACIMISPDLKLAAGTARVHSSCWVQISSLLESYIVHLMTAEDLSLHVDAATHSASQVIALKKVLARLLEGVEMPYLLFLESMEPRYIQEPHDSLSYGIRTLIMRLWWNLSISVGASLQTSVVSQTSKRRSNLRSSILTFNA